MFSSLSPSQFVIHVNVQKAISFPMEFPLMCLLFLLSLFSQMFGDQLPRQLVDMNIM